jgi:molecular chaperone GrpE (heat shock protein)
MLNQAQVKAGVAKWPFFLADAFLLACGALVWTQRDQIAAPWPAPLLVVCVVAAVICGLAPFVLEFRAWSRLAQVELVDDAVARIAKVEELAQQISGATGTWQTAQEHAEKTTTAAKDLQERMTRELQSFMQFMERANNSEKAALKLEVEKLRRGETEWIQVLIFVLDHVFAVHQGALRSGQANLIEQLTHFQNACRDAARRVGLTPFAPSASDPFDPQRHQTLDTDGEATPASSISAVIAPGYTFQGRMLRAALVRVVRPEGQTTPVGGPAAPPPAEAEKEPAPSEIS